MLIRACLLTGNLSQSLFWEVQLECVSEISFQVPSEGPVELWEHRGLGLNRVTRERGVCPDTDKTKEMVSFQWLFPLTLQPFSRYLRLWRLS